MSRFPFPALLGAALMLNLAACSTGGPRSMARAAAPVAEVPDVAPQAMVFVARDGAPVAWDEVVTRARQADIVVLGEQHNDLLAHRVQTALVTAILAEEKAAVCLEMLERDEQPFVDAWLAGTIDQKSLVDITDSKDWGAPGQWNAFYQPTLDAAKAMGAPVIAANAPRRFTRLGRLEGFETLTALAPHYPGQFVVPGTIEESAYRERFLATMSHHGPAPAPKKKAKGEKEAPAHPMPALDLDALFRAQQVWDATMADSVIAAQQEHGKAVLLVGQFHTDHDGGLLLRMKAANPALTCLVISVQSVESGTLLAEDADRADIVVYRPARK